MLRTQKVITGLKRRGSRSNFTAGLQIGFYREAPAYEYGIIMSHFVLFLNHLLNSHLTECLFSIAIFCTVSIEEVYFSLSLQVEKHV